MRNEEFIIPHPPFGGLPLKQGKSAGSIFLCLARHFNAVNRYEVTLSRIAPLS